MFASANWTDSSGGELSNAATHIGSAESSPAVAGSPQSKIPTNLSLISIKMKTVSQCLLLR
jgi:hypothetical protein